MADYGLLAIADLPVFDTFMLLEGYDSVPTKGPYEERRYKAPGTPPVILFKRDSARVHVTVQNKDYPLVRRFITYKHKR